MAVKVMTPVEGPVNKITKFSLEAATSASDGFVFTLPKKTEEYLVIVVANTGNTNYSINLKQPTKKMYASATADKTLSLGAGEYAQIRIESARYANSDGTVVLVPENVAVKAAVLY